MDHLAVVACSGCGAGLPVRANQNVAVCRFCNASTPLENPVVQEARQSSAAVEATLAAGLKALLDALTRAFAPNAGISLAMGLGCMVLGMTSVIPLFLGAIQCLKRNDEAYYAMAAFPLFPAAFFAFITIAQLYANHLPRLRAGRRIKRLRAEFDLAPQPGNCPNCGGQCQIPGSSATFDCVYCHTPLLAAAGMLVVWGQEASQQAEGWSAEAKRISKVLADRLRARIVAYVGGGFIFTFALLCSSAYYVLTVVLPGMDAIPCQLRLALPIVIEIPLIALLVLAVRRGWLDIGIAPSKGKKKRGAAPRAAAAPSRTPAAKGGPPEYKIGDTGPAGGLVFYVADAPRPGGWRHLEAAPTDIHEGDEDDLTKHRWYQYDVVVRVATGSDIGAGRGNTKAIVKAYSVNPSAGSYAAQLCQAQSYGKFKDWFLPSKSELDLLYSNLHKNGLGRFTPEAYWSSTQAGEDARIWVQNFENGNQELRNAERDKDCRIRAVRAF